MSANPKVSIIMPSLNVVSYIRECIESVINQTLKDIEIICVDAGSTDGTLEILQDYAQRDKRIQLIISSKKSYGYQMNLGMDAAQGKYIGIVETDDYASPDMFEILYNEAEKHQADFVKTNYFWYTTKPSIQNKPFNNLLACPKDVIFCPMENKKIFTVTPSIWSAVYSKELLLKNKIRFNETPGASYQDTSFHFMVCTVSKRCYLIDKYLLHYRRDNENSSVNSAGKVYCISDEMHYYEEFLANRPLDREQIEPFYMTLKYEKYRWNYARLAPQFQWEFLELMHKEFQEAAQKGLLYQELFANIDWANLNAVLKDPIRYFQDHCKIYSTRPNFSKVYPFSIICASACSDPEVSVIIPIYNSYKYISETIESVLNQTLKNIEIVCVNDGSTDTTMEILLRYAKKDSRITILDQINKGQAAARNVGLSVAKGKYIYFLDSDDLIERDALKNLIQIAMERNLDILYFDGKSFYESEDLKKKYPYYLNAYEYDTDLPKILTGQELFCQMKKDKKYRTTACLSIYSKKYLDQHHLRFIEGIFHEDDSFTFECMMYAMRVAHIKEKYLLRRVHRGSTMTMQKTFIHLYGYLMAFFTIQKVAKKIKYNDNIYYYIASELNTVCNLIRATYKQQKNGHSVEEKLNAIEKLYVKQFILPQKSIAISQIHEAELIRASYSYKIGRGITWFPRKIRGLKQCYSEHGLSYTLYRIMDHFKGRR